MKEKADVLLKALNDNEIEKGEALALQMIDDAEHSFMEQLTLETATDLVGTVLLYCEFCAKEKKPWKASAQMDRVEGALRFMADFMSDRMFAAKTLYQIAANYSYAGFYPEARKYYEMSIDVSGEFDEAEDAVYFALINAFRMGADTESKVKKRFEQVLGSGRFNEVLSEAKEDFSKEILRDPLEREDSFLKIRFILEEEIDKELSCSCEDHARPFCIRYWDTKKRLLSERFGLEWKSPADMNPDIRFC